MRVGEREGLKGERRFRGGVICDGRRERWDKNGERRGLNNRNREEGRNWVVRNQLEEEKRETKG